MPFLAVSAPASSSLTLRTFEKDRSCCMGAWDAGSLMHQSQLFCFIHKEETIGDFVFS